MIAPGDVVSYLDMCRAEGVNLQRGMNFRLQGGFSVILMNLRPGAPYADRVEEGGRVLIYEGHDVPRRRNSVDPKKLDQLAETPSGTLTQNGQFYGAALAYKCGQAGAELVRVYEKLRPGIWVHNGVFQLVDAWHERTNARKVFKFKLRLVEDTDREVPVEQQEISCNRLIPSTVKLAVWKRDRGRCTVCGRNDNLHFDHIIPYRAMHLTPVPTIYSVSSRGGLSQNLSGI